MGLNTRSIRYSWKDLPNRDMSKFDSIILIKNSFSIFVSHIIDDKVDHGTYNIICSM